MADPAFNSTTPNVFTGQPTVQPAAQPTLGQVAQPSPVPIVGPPKNADELNARASRWDAFFSNPAVLSAMLQFGVQALQPLPPGQSNLGALGQSIAAGGEAAGRVQKIQREEAATKTSQEQAQQRIDTEKRRAEIEQQRADIAGQQLDFEKDWRSKWLEIQRMTANLDSLRLQAENAANDIARERLAAETKQAEEALKFRYKELATKTATTLVENADKRDISLLSGMYKAAQENAFMHGGQVDMGALHKDFLQMRQLLQDVRKGSANVFDIGSEQQWRTILSDPDARAQAEERFGKDIVDRAQKEIDRLDKERTKTGGPR